jgi:hypothetical protein
MWKELNETPVLETLPLDWFPDRAAVRAFIQGARFYALSSLVLDAIETNLPQPLASSVQDAAFFVGKDLFELSRVAAIPGEEAFEYSERELADSGLEWQDQLSSLAVTTLGDSLPDAISRPIIAMLAKAEASERDRHQAQLAESAPNRVQCICV